MRIQKVVYRDKGSGQKICFDNRFLYVESIDTTGLSGVHITEELVGVNGQQTIGHRLGARVIPCSFALNNRIGDKRIYELIVSMFNPLRDGILTVCTGSEEFSIDVYPQNVPVFQKQTVPYITKWTVDFSADYPLWRVGMRKEIYLKGPSTTFRSGSLLDLPVEIYFRPDYPSTPFNINGRGFTIRAYDNKSSGVTVNSRTFEVTDDSGNNVNYLIDAAAPLDEFFLKYGENTIFCPEYNDVSVHYYNLTLGVYD